MCSIKIYLYDFILEERIRCLRCKTFLWMEHDGNVLIKVSSYNRRFTIFNETDEKTYTHL